MSIDKNQLKITLLDQKESFRKHRDYVARDIAMDKYLKTSKIVAITGIRRCGKSTLLKQISANFVDYYYVNFEDERFLNFTSEDFNGLLEVCLEVFGKSRVFFFDEIQNVRGWEKFVSRLFADGYKIFVTGSNAKLLSSELATSLTGRHLRLELYPFSFMEFLLARRFVCKRLYSTEEIALVKRYFNEYLQIGGFPEVIESGNSDELKQIYQDIIIKDLIVRFSIKDVKSFRELAFYLLSNTAKPISFNNLKKILDFKSVMTVKNYISFLEEAYLNFLVYKYDFSLKKQIINDRKIYAIDNGLVKTVAFDFSGNEGRLLENLVFLELKRKNCDIYYYKEDKECDFLIKEGRKIIQAIQVSLDFSSVAVKEREIGGLMEVCVKYDLKEGIILTRDNEEVINEQGIRIKVVPIYKWLIGLS